MDDHLSADRNDTAVEIAVEAEVSREDLATLHAGLRESSLTRASIGEHLPLTVLARDRAGRVRGGVHGNTGGVGWLYIDTLWVDDGLRGQGIGTKLMDVIEGTAIVRGCRNAYLDTFSFQAPEFYARRGYEAFGELDDFPPGHRRHFLRKRLVSTSDEPTIRTGLRPGDIGAITSMHGLLYAREYGWDHTFEAYVAGPLAEFALRTNPRERIWIVESAGRVAGSIAIVEASQSEAQLRWLLIDPGLRGKGVGRRLMDEAIEFCRARDYRSVMLSTVSALEPAAALYRSSGFIVVEEATHRIWGAELTEQRYVLSLTLPVKNEK